MEFKAADIATFLNGEIVGDGNITVNQVSKIEEGKPGSLAFLSNMKYENFIYETSASVVLVNKTFIPRGEIKATLIKVDDAYQAFAALLDLYLKARAHQKSGIEQPSFIDLTSSVGEDIYIGAFAYIGRKSKIGNHTKIYPQVHIGDNVIIGDDCTLYPGVKIYDDCVIGDRCILHAGCVIGSDGFGFAPQADGRYKKIPQIGNVVLENDVEIGANTTIDCGTTGPTTIREGVKIDNLVQIAHNCDIGENTVIAAQTGLAGSTRVGKNCRFGGQVGVAGHLTIGNNVQLGAQSGVSKSVKDNEIHWLTPSFDHKEAVRTAIVFRNLPQLREEVTQLQKEIKLLKQKI